MMVQEFVDALKPTPRQWVKDNDGAICVHLDYPSPGTQYVANIFEGLVYFTKGFIPLDFEHAQEVLCMTDEDYNAIATSSSYWHDVLRGQLLEACDLSPEG